MPVRIFLVDDHPVVQNGIKSILKAQSGIEVVGEASDGRQAVREIVKSKPDVAIMDIAMPYLNGIEATRQIVENLPSCKVIILSMHDSAEHIHHAFQAGAWGYLLKASVGQEIVEAIQAVRAGKHFLSHGISNILVNEFLVKNLNEPKKNPLELLSQREREILQLVAEGHSSAKIGEILFISPKTVDTYRSRMMEKLNISDLPALVKFAIRHGLTPLE